VTATTKNDERTLPETDVLSRNDSDNNIEYYSRKKKELENIIDVAKELHEKKYQKLKADSLAQKKTISSLNKKILAQERAAAAAAAEIAHLKEKNSALKKKYDTLKNRKVVKIADFFSRLLKR
jgi:uncharacterized coiled-coil protein SlyX